MVPGTQYDMTPFCDAVVSISVQAGALSAGQCSSFTVYGNAHAAGLKQVLMVGVVSALAWLSL